MAKKIYLSPSDQSDNAYAAGNTTEALQCKKIADACAKYLKANGYTVKVGSQSIGYVGRVKESNSWGADVHIPIHTNAGGGDGTLVMSYTGYTNNKYVKNVYNEVAKVSPGKDDGIRVRTNLYEITETIALCVYVECEFHDNATLANWIISHVDDLGKAIAKGICLADGKTFKTPSSGESTSKPITGKLWKVQCGAYESKTNAEAQVKKLKASGFDAFAYQSGRYYKVQCGAFKVKENAIALEKKLEAKGFDVYVYQD